MLSALNPREPDHKEIALQLKKQMGISYTGSLYTMRPNEGAPVGWLEIGELVPVEMGFLDRPPPALNFWLQNLCYDPLLVYHRNGEIDGRLATACEAVKGNSQWQLTLRADLRWSDGKPITLEEVISAFSASRIAPIITEIKSESTTQLRVQLSQEEALFPLHLRGIFVHPSPLVPTLPRDLRPLSVEALWSGCHDLPLHAKPGLLSRRKSLHQLVDRKTFYAPPQCA